MIEAQIQNAAVVMLGQFNPAIFSPEWLNRVGLLKESEVEAAEVSVIHPEMTLMKIGAIDLQIGPGRLAASTPEVPFVRVQEFVSNLIGHILPHTPINALGINFEEHFVVSSPEKRIALGRLLAPVGPWGAWGEVMDASPAERASGLIKLSMRETEPDGREGWFMVEIGPSAEISKFQAVKINSNDHYAIKESRLASSAEVAALTLSDNFELSQKKAMSIFTQMRELADRVPS